ncbi:MAG: winged helix-turn-helix transcriptional regulator [Betaproteobacteria bacterium]|nr:winged helix-turn-helix transcriptional regulator [Betaproteobacteria bacterium]
MTTATTTGRPKSARAAIAAESAAENPQPLVCTGARLRRLTRRVTAFYEHHMRDSGLKLSQYSLLAQLSEDPQSLTTLADRMEIDRTTLTRSLQPLLEQGWVAESSGTDARQRLFVRTASGTRTRNAARKYWRQAQLALEQHLGQGFVANFHARLDQALSRLKPALPEDN